MKIFLECATCDVDGNGDGDNLAAPAATNLQLQQAAKKIINKAKWKRIMRKRLFSILLQFIATRRERQRGGEIVIHLLVNKLWQAAARMRIRRVQRTWARATRKNAEMFNWKTFVIKLLKLCAHKARQRGETAGEGGSCRWKTASKLFAHKSEAETVAQRFRFGFRIEFCVSASRMNNAKVIYLFTFIPFDVLYIFCFISFCSSWYSLFYFICILTAQHLLASPAAS